MIHNIANPSKTNVLIFILILHGFNEMFLIFVYSLPKMGMSATGLADDAGDEHLMELIKPAFSGSKCVRISSIMIPDVKKLVVILGW